ncbi:uncharacterized protein K444DRAFT_635528 [Hyaloscypha bicolor E]|uniref:BTB domain-containing protein n=1 Tax=Hyaloscypha bicolor E TaxID=1095630 RepID=A0A2J6SR92_9HELO|nr:uncharacterized protein K444DRAFT_635528 [Hyaloscypha bicolor E]PMD53301.1 hypothetical protein K444DRAFT_635528 [Hyaloscypha bicolor E]
MVEPNTSGPLKTDDFTFDCGDVDIKVKLSSEDTITVGKVSSSAMAMASPVWKKFVYPPFSRIQGWHSTGGVTIKELDFTEDYPLALLILLRVAHLRFRAVPVSPSTMDKANNNNIIRFELLVQLATLCDEYDCVDLVKPWYHTWFANWESKPLEYGQEKESLLIAWTFGMEKSVESLTKNLVRELSINEDGKANFGIIEGDILPIPQSLIVAWSCTRRRVVGFAKETRSTVRYCATVPFLKASRILEFGRGRRLKTFTSVLTNFPRHSTAARYIPSTTTPTASVPPKYEST